ncbi:hypothetical protein ACFFV7_50845 [Nonomuraea spiralis]|uniref:Uncharacterized protein n=1 Tax=Nonomuraea spiralis TaxID=46182 RepID=A0ABV5IYB7_9ACTN|nr:hypothetical protein [Nonomuraea spiralis]GGS88663.1 hypothetical protein GCM10010176_035570 [Nonomuraea spiralis]
MGFLFCLACGATVEENADGDWESATGTACRKRTDGHLVEQVIPDPEGPA